MKEQRESGTQCGAQHKRGGTRQVGVLSEHQREHNRKPPAHAKAGDTQSVHHHVTESLFDGGSVPPDAAGVLEEFGRIVDTVSPLPAKKQEELPRCVNQMSRLLTSCRGERRVGYMNSLDLQAAYVRYFCWWNLVRLVRLFSNMTPSFFDLADGDVAVDVGSGPLTLPIALYLARPELQRKRLVWYCTDLSQGVLRLGERLLERVQRATGGGAWQVVRVQGGLDVPLKRKATLVSCANFLNELVCGREDDQQLCDRITRSLLSHLQGDERSRLLLVEPGEAASSARLTRLRGHLIERGFTPASPCTHSGDCPMSGKWTDSGKWCNFVFDTDGAPAGLKELSRQAGLDKRRASLCFVAMSQKHTSARTGDMLDLRVTGGRMRLEGGEAGWYACCRRGLVVAQSRDELSSGERLCVPLPREPLARDGKTGLAIVRV